MSNKTEDKEKEKKKLIEKNVKGEVLAFTQILKYRSFSRVLNDVLREGLKLVQKKLVKILKIYNMVLLTKFT